MNKFNPNDEEEEEKDNLQKALEGNNLKVKDANYLLQRILYAIVVNENEGEEAIYKELNKADSKGIEKPDPTPGPSDVDKKNPDEKKPETEKSKEICHFYTINKCKFGKDCIKKHPKICPKFKKFGLKKFNKSGCEESCENYHPKACFEAMKSKTCNRTGCKFFHITGTKKSDNASATVTPIHTSNSFSQLAQNQSAKEQIFQKAKEPWELAIEKMSMQMEQMMKWQQMQMNIQENQNFEKNNYNSNTTPNLRPHTIWPTQSQTQSQSQRPYTQN